MSQVDAIVSQVSEASAVYEKLQDPLRLDGIARAGVRRSPHWRRIAVDLMMAETVTGKGKETLLPRLLRRNSVETLGIDAVLNIQNPQRPR